MDYGIDGCKAGWVAVGIQGDATTVAVYPTIADFWADCGEVADRVWIDMPIGLPPTGNRQPEAHARALLGPRRSSVFSVPVCAAFAPELSYTAACKINQQHTGKKFSKQTWHIMPKIRELDLFLRGNATARDVFLECHPELVFRALCGGVPMPYSKKHPLGFLDRLQCLEKSYTEAEDLLRAAVKRYALSITDDVLDALALALAARNGAFTSLPDPPEIDAHGLPMRMAYPQFDVTPKLKTASTMADRSK